MSDLILRQKLETIQILVNECLDRIGSAGDLGRQKKLNAEVAEPLAEDLVAVIANKIADCAEAEKIRTNVLLKRDLERRILLCFYISYKYFSNMWLTTGQIEKITSELNIKVDTGNASNKLKTMRQYVESKAVRKNGQPTPYRLNQIGLKRFEEVLNG